MPPIVTRKLEDSPRRYPKVANFISSDRNFLQFRRFLELQCRVLLDVQYDIQLLEQELDELDHWDFEQGDSKRRKCLTCIERDRGTAASGMPEEWKTNPDRKFMRTRPALLAELRSALLEYNELLLTTKEVATLKRPSDRYYLSVVNWFESNKPLVSDEADYIKRREDWGLARVHSVLRENDALACEGESYKLFNRLNG